jgi:hypothetical protein
MDPKEELAKVLRERAGLDQPTSEQAAKVAIDYLKEHGPSLLQRIGAGKLGKELGGIFGR